MIRGTDIIGQALYNALVNFGGKVGEGFQAEKTQQEQQGILAKLLNQTEPGAPQVDATSNAPVVMGEPRQVGPYAPQNAGLLAQLLPQYQAALQSTQTRGHIFPNTPAGTSEVPVDAFGNTAGAVKSLVGPVPPKPESPDVQLVTKPALAPDGKTHNFIVGVDKKTMKETGPRIDVGEVPATAKGVGMGGAAADALTPEMKEFYYQQAKTDGVMPRIPGMGGALATIALQKYVAQRAKQEGIPGTAFAAQRAVYSTAKTGLSQVTKMSDTLTPNANAVSKFIGLVQSQLDSGYQPPTESPLVNEWAQFVKGEKLTGDPQYQRYKNYIYAAVREYAKVVSGASGSVQGLSDFASKDAQGILNVMQTPDAARASLETMMKDVEAMKSSWEEQKMQLRSEIKNVVQPEKPSQKKVGKFTIEKVE